MDQVVGTVEHQMPLCNSNPIQQPSSGQTCSSHSPFPQTKESNVQGSLRSVNKKEKPVSIPEPDD